MLAFLCGGMEYAADGGRHWRERIRLWLQENLNHRVYDPVLETQRLLSEEELRNFRAWKSTDQERYRKILRHMINHDMHVMENQVDYVICLWEEAAARGGGTQAELTAAFRKGIPVYLVAEMLIVQVSGWVLGCADKVLSSFDELSRPWQQTTVRRRASGCSEKRLSSPPHSRLKGRVRGQAWAGGHYHEKSSRSSGASYCSGYRVVHFQGGIHAGAPGWRSAQGSD